MGKQVSRYLRAALRLPLVLMFGIMFCGTVPAGAATATAQAADQNQNIIEDEAVQALYTMGAYLRTLKTFGVESDFFKDDVLVTGQKILVSGESSYLVQLPDKLFANVKINEKDRDIEAYFNGEQFTLYGKKHHYYATVPAHGTVGDLVLKTFAEQGIELPLQDLFLWGTSPADKGNLISAFIAGKAAIDGKDCTHYAFRQEGVDWQVWIQDGEQSLPLQLVITTTSDTSHPQYSARIKWNLDLTIAQDIFTFTPPKGALPIRFLSEFNPDGVQ